jgi:toxin ParE1/3/4
MARKKRFEVAVTDGAVEDLREIGEYIALRDSAAAARKQLKKLRTRIEALATSPSRGRVPPELAERGIRTWRETVVAPWRIVYRVDEGFVYVLVVVDGRRDLSEWLLRRLTRPR